MKPGSLVLPNVFNLDDRPPDNKITFNFVFLFSGSALEASADEPVAEWYIHDGPGIVLKVKEFDAYEDSIKVFVAGKIGWISTNFLNEI